MKKIISFIFLLCLIASATSAQNVTIKGKVEGYNGALALARIGEKMDTLNVEKDGSFVLKAEVRNPNTQGIVLVMSDLPIVVFEVNPGDNIEFHLSVDENGEPWVSFNGDNKEYNNFLTGFGVVTNSPLFLDQESMANKTFIQYSNVVDKELDKLSAMLKKIKDHPKKQNMAVEVDIARKDIKFRYGWAMSMVGKMVDSDPDFVAFVESIDLNSREVLNGESQDMGMGMSYSGLLDQRLRWEVERSSGKVTGDNMYIVLLNAISTFITDQDIRNFMAEKVISSYFVMGTDDHLLETFNTYKKVTTDANAVKKMERKYAEHSDLQFGKMAPDFTMFDVHGNKLRLSDLRGKALYIDVWATWCGPCVFEVPFMKKLYEQYKDNPGIDFISISVDDNTGEWKKKVEEEKYEWKNYIIEGGFRGDLNRLYYISGIPRFMIIDKEGKIVTIQAMRPSEEGIHEMLEKYLK